ncbi:unnamed protein product [Fusarium langsethiae]|nr:unnamed protein product [Fusarium langsethiae]
MAASVLVRRIVLNANESAIDANLDQDYGLQDEIVKLFLTMPSGHAVSIITSRCVVLNALLTTPHPQNPELYRWAQYLGWVAFGTQVISIGMTCLLVQLLVVIIMYVSTVLVVGQTGSVEYRVGSKLVFTRVEADPKEGFRTAAYARLWLTETEEESMLMWGLFPQRSNIG